MHFKGCDIIVKKSGLINIQKRFSNISIFVSILAYLLLVPIYIHLPLAVTQKDYFSITIAILCVIIAFAMIFISGYRLNHVRSVKSFVRSMTYTNPSKIAVSLKRMHDVDVIIAHEFARSIGRETTRIVEEMVERKLLITPDILVDDSLFIFSDGTQMNRNTRILLSNEFVYVATLMPFLRDFIIPKKDVVVITSKDWFVKRAIKLVYNKNGLMKTLSITTPNMQKWISKMKEYGYNYKD